jgi:hypothetical protein
MFFLLVALLLAIVLMAMAFGDTRHSAANDRLIDAQFHRTERFVTAFKRAHGKLPSREELEALPESKKSGYAVHIVDATRDSIAKEAFSTVGHPPPGGYVLSIWRGEWMEYYASWSGKSSVPDDQSSYYVTGSRRLDLFLGGSLMMLCLFIARWLWKGQAPSPRVPISPSH